MTEADFIEKWRGNETSWVDTASRLYWARSYHMEQQELLEMSTDFLMLPYDGWCSSRDLAKHITKEK